MSIARRLIFGVLLGMVVEVVVENMHLQAVALITLSQTRHARHEVQFLNMGRRRRGRRTLRVTAYPNLKSLKEKKE